MTNQTYRRLRERIGTQAAVARALGVSERTLRRRENGKAKITREMASALRAVATKVAR